MRRDATEALGSVIFALIATDTARVSVRPSVRPSVSLSVQSHAAAVTCAAGLLLSCGPGRREMSIDSGGRRTQRCTWVGSIHGLRWIEQCHVYSQRTRLSTDLFSFSFSFKVLCRFNYRFCSHIDTVQCTYVISDKHF